VVTGGVRDAGYSVPVTVIMLGVANLSRDLFIVTKERS
jgi:hypothetical protein